MNYIYHHELSKIIECITLLEYDVNKKDYYSVFYSLIHTKNDSKLKENDILLLDKLKNEMGKLLEGGTDLSFLFQYKTTNFSYFKDYIISYMKHPFLSIDEYKEQILALYENDTLCFLRFMIQNEENQYEIDSYREEEIINQMNLLEISDTLKWKMILMQKNYISYMNQLFNLLEKVMQIYNLYEEELNVILNHFESDLSDQNRYKEFFQQNKLSFLDDDLEVHIYPSVANLASVFFDDQTRGKNCAWICFGVYLMHANIQNETMCTDDICNTLKILSDKSKFEILNYISKQSAYGTQIAKEMQLSTATISYHMQYLLDKRFVEVEKRNNRLYYKCNKEAVVNFLRIVGKAIVGE